MRPAIGILAAFINPLFSEAGPINPDALPTWSLAGACAAFLAILGWAIRFVVLQGRAGAVILYSDVIKPAAQAHVGLMDTLAETRQQDSTSLKSIADTQRAIQGDIESLRDTKATKHV